MSVDRINTGPILGFILFMILGIRLAMPWWYFLVAFLYLLHVEYKSK